MRSGAHLVRRFSVRNVPGRSQHVLGRVRRSNAANSGQHSPSAKSKKSSRSRMLFAKHSSRLDFTFVESGQLIASDSSLITLRWWRHGAGLDLK